MKNLFEETKNELPNSMIKTSLDNSNNLTKEQSSFILLLGKLEKLEIDIQNDYNKFESLLKYFNTVADPKLNELRHLKMNFIELLDQVYPSLNLSPRQQRQFFYLVQMLMKHLFEYSELTEEQIKLYDKWHPGYKYNEMLAEEEEFMKEELSDIIWDAFGVDIDLDNFGNGPEGAAELEKLLRESMSNMASDQGEKKKTKSQVQQEIKQKVELDMKVKSLRQIYIALAKWLHPDTSLNDKDKEYKAELMKQVTIAYEQKDLYTLLKLEMRWMQQDSVEHADQDKMVIYSKMLKDQLKELKLKREMQMNDYRYSNIDFCKDLSDKKAMKHIDEYGLFLSTNINDMNQDYLKIKNSKQVRRDIVELLIQATPDHI